MRDEVAEQLGNIRAELDALREEIRAVRSDLTQMAIEQRTAISNVKIGLVRLEQLLDAKFQTTKLIERVALSKNAWPAPEANLSATAGAN